MMRLKTKKQYLLVLLLALLALPSWGQTKNGDSFDYKGIRYNVVAEATKDRDTVVVAAFRVMDLNELSGAGLFKNGVITVPFEFKFEGTDYKVKDVADFHPDKDEFKPQVIGIKVSEGIRTTGWLSMDHWNKLQWVDLPSTLEEVNGRIATYSDEMTEYRICGSKDRPESQKTAGGFFTEDGVLYQRWTDGNNVTHLVLKAYPMGRPGYRDETISQYDFYDMEDYHVFTYTDDDIAAFESDNDPSNDKYIAGEFKYAELRSAANGYPKENPEKPGEIIEVKDDVVQATAYRVKDGTEIIDGLAFYRDHTPNVIILPNSVKDLGDGYYDGGVVKFVLEEGNTVLSHGTNADDLEAVYQKVGEDSLKLVRYPMFYNPYGTYTMPSNVVALSDRAFIKCRLTSVDFSHATKLKSIPGYPFRSCGYINELVIPKSVEKIGEEMARYVEFYRIIVDPENPVFQNIHVPADNKKDYVLYSKGDPLTLVQYPHRYPGQVLIEDPETGKSHYEYQVADGTKVIGAGAFESAGIEGIILPNSLDSIADAAFKWTALKNMNFSTPDGSASNLRIISTGAFYGCGSLESVVIPSSIEKIKSAAFEYCEKLSDVNFGDLDNLQEIGAYAFNGCVSMNAELDLSGTTQLTTIGNRAFNNVPLTSVSFPASLASIGESAFSKDKNAKDADGESVLGKLTKVNIPNDAQLTEIEKDAFKNNKSYDPAAHDDNFRGLTDANGNFLPSITKIGNRAFLGCNMQKCVVNKNIVALGSQAFLLNPNLKAIEVDAENAYYSDLDGMLMNKNQSKLLAYPSGKEKTNFAFQKDANYAIVPPVEEVGDSVFYGATAVTDVKIPASVNKVGRRAFYNTPNLKALSMMRDTLYSDLVVSLTDYFDDTHSASSTAKLYVRKNQKAGYEGLGNVYDVNSTDLFHSIVPSSSTDLVGGYSSSQYGTPEYFAWTVDGDLTDDVALVGFDSSNENTPTMKTVIIPSVIKVKVNNDYRSFNVTKVADNAFKGADAVESATFFCTPDYIGSGAFAGKNLSEVYFVNLTNKTAQGASPLATDASNFGTKAQSETAEGQTIYVKENVFNNKDNYYLTAANADKVQYQIKKVAPKKVNSRSYSASTSCREFPVKFSAQVEVYRVEKNSQYERDDDERNEVDKGTGITGYLKAYKVDNTHGVPAGEAVLVVNKNGSTDLPNAYYQMMDDNDVDAISNNGMVGAYGAVDLVSSNGIATGYVSLPINADGTQKASVESTSDKVVYALNTKDDKCYFSKISSTVKQFPAYKGFFLAPSGTNLSKGFLMFDLDGEIATAIDRAIQAEDADATWYNVDGSKLEGRPSVKGVYIRNGKKFVVK